MIRRIEVFASYAVGALTLVGLALIFLVPVATEGLSENGHTTTTPIYAIQQGNVLRVVLIAALFVVLAALLISSARTHQRTRSWLAVFSVVSVGLIYIFMSGQLMFFIGGAMQYADIPALICVVLSFIPSRRHAQPGQPTQPAPTVTDA